MRDTPIVAIDHVTKRFKAHVALDRVSLSLRKGELHAIVGENGAGKSTLMNILFGLQQPDEGGILIDGRQVIHRSPSDAIANGIGMVHQHFKLVPSFTVKENLCLAARPAVRAKLRTDRDVAAIAERYGMTLDPSALTGRLPLAIQQRVEILKALVNEAVVLILDEPTTILNPREAESLYGVLGHLTREGHAVVAVTHHLDEVLRYSDRVSVIRHGTLVGTALTKEMNRDALVQQIVGRSVAVDSRLPGRVDAVGEEELRLEGVSVPGTAFSSGLHAVDLTVRAGEVVGIAGVEGNGQRELFDILAGLRAPVTGRVWTRAMDARQRPIVNLVPEDRHTEGLILDLPVSINLLLDQLDGAAYSRFGVLRHGAIAMRARDLAKTYDVRTADIALPARSLSGGNQQKIVIARALSGAPRVLIVYQPTRGLDVAASEEVLARLRGAADDGLAVLLISSNLQEIMRMSDRIKVLYEGEFAGEIAGVDATADRLGQWMVGGRDADIASRMAS
ncbi:ABC transporter ATP-binding protein [Beijerinckia sp. L45]|uniref:ABC transporter ATP-binding protein n=1 Tax=Beijerinckia sp. L45 TaxID=1641855 RepID=UPI00131DE0A2|nr:ABC transporter ATP-binding protein [Beijerinckia sp. L45]